MEARRSGDDPGLVRTALTLNDWPGLTSVVELVTPRVGLGRAGRPYTNGSKPGLGTGATGTPPLWSPVATRLTRPRPPPVASNPQAAIATVLPPSSLRMPAGT